MTIDIPIKTLREILRAFRCITKAKLPILNYVQATVGHTATTLTMTDLDQYITARIENSRQSEVAYSTLVPLQALKDAQHRRLSKSTVSLRLDQNLIEVEEAGRSSHYTFTPGDVADFPPAPEAQSDVLFLDNTQSEALVDAAGFVTSDPTREVLKHVELKADSITATDGRYLYTNWIDSLDLEAPLLIPGSKLLAQMAAKDVLAVGREAKTTWGLVRNHWLQWQFRRSPLSFPNWQAVVPQQKEEDVQVLLSEGDLMYLRDHVGKLPFIREDSAPITLHVEGDQLTVITGSTSPQCHKLSPDEVVAGNGPSYVSVDYGRLKKSLDLGIRSFRFRDELCPLCGYVGSKTTVTMPLRTQNPPTVPVSTERLGEVRHG